MLVCRSRIVRAKLSRSSRTGKTVLMIHLPREFEPANRKLPYARTWGSLLSSLVTCGSSAPPCLSRPRSLSVAQALGLFDLSVSFRIHISGSLSTTDFCFLVGRSANPHLGQNCTFDNDRLAQSQRVSFKRYLLSAHRSWKVEHNSICSTDVSTARVSETLSGVKTIPLQHQSNTTVFWERPRL